MKKGLSGSLLAGCAGAALCAVFLAGPAFAADKTIKIGNVEPLSGPSASVGIQGKQAREMAIEEINAAGGIKSLGGAKLELVYADSSPTPPLASPRPSASSTPKKSTS